MMTKEHRMKYSTLLVGMMSSLLCLTCFVACRHKTAEIVIVPDVLKNHLQRNHIYGNVKEITTYTLLSRALTSSEDTANVEEAIFDTAWVFVQLYSKDGYLLSTCKLTPEKDTLLARTYHYLSDARLESWKEIDFQSNTTVECRYEYDVNDFLSAEKIFADDSLMQTTTYKTDGMGNVIEMVRHYDGYSLKNCSQYNENGLLSRVEEYDPSGKVYKYVTIEYDNFGDEVNRRAFKGENDLIEYTYTQYNQDGSLSKVIFEDRLHDSREHYDYADYDQENNWTVETRTKDKKLIYKRIRNYIYY